MHSSSYWIAHFKTNATHHRVDWNLSPALTEQETNTILRSLQAWQLGETSDGKHLLRAATRYARRIDDPAYVEAVKLFIKEEQKHGGNLGRYLDKIGQPRIEHDWGDSLFRKIRYFNTSMELWTLAVIVVESTAQVFYQSLKNASKCELLQQICNDILIDEAHHITFQAERLSILFEARSPLVRSLYGMFYKCFFYSTSLVVWMAHRKLFRAGGNDFGRYKRKMSCKYRKTIGRITRPVSFGIELQDA